MCVPISVSYTTYQLTAVSANLSAVVRLGNQNHFLAPVITNPALAQTIVSNQDTKLLIQENIALVKVLAPVIVSVLLLSHNWSCISTSLTSVPAIQESPVPAVAGSAVLLNHLTKPVKVLPLTQVNFIRSS